MNIKLLPYILVRYGVALALLFYGFAKLNGAQFTILDSELDKPMGQVSGFWLTWYYFGYSKVYGTFIALAQVFGAILLLFRRTTLLGVFLLLPMVSNIVLVDLFYGIGLDVAVVALVLDLGLLFLLAVHGQEVLDLFWRHQRFPSEPASFLMASGKWVVRAALIVIPAFLTYQVANYSNRDPTPIDGIWEVMRVSPNLSGSPAMPTVIFFERNRAHLCVFKYGDRSYRWRHFEVDEEKHSITIWEHWKFARPGGTRGKKIFDGHYELSGSRLSLTGRFEDEGELTMVLQRTSPGT